MKLGRYYHQLSHSGQVRIECDDDLAAGTDALRHGDGRIGRIERKQLTVATDFDIAHAIHDKYAYVAWGGQGI